MPSWKRVAFCALMIAWSAAPLRAQKGSGGAPRSTAPPGASSPGRTDTSPTYTHGPTVQPGIEERPLIADMPQLPKPSLVEDETCLPWDLPGVRGATVSVIRLEVPSKARSEYEKGCDSFRKKKMPDAEKHVRDAIQKYSNYVAAWVMLGQVLEGEQKISEAHEACSHALSIDPNYLPSYLCLAGLLDRDNQWGDLLDLSNRALGLNPVGDRYAYYYRAIAYFHIYKLPEAQKSALEAIGIDREHRQPGLHFLLAQIYAEQGDLTNAAAQIQQFLKFNNDRQNEQAAREYLAKLESQQAAK
jgi:predicted Zn-dependent protease